MVSPYYISVNDITNYWSSHNNTDVNANIIQIANTNPNDGSDVEKRYGKMEIIVCLLLSLR